MENELFGSIRDNYNNASFHLWSWYKRKNLLIKILFIPWVIVASVFMKAIGFFFSLGVFLDKISTWLQTKRGGVINSVEKASSNLKREKHYYLFSPIKVIILAPIALLLGIIPKWSSTLSVGLHPDLDISSTVEYGYFTNLGREYLRFLKSLYSSLTRHGKLFFVFGLILTLLFTPIVLLIALIFFALIILDYIGWIVSLIRSFVVTSSRSMARVSGKNAGSVILMPTLLVIFVPIYVALLLIPKIATYDRG